MLNWIKNKLAQRRINLENEIRQTHYDLLHIGMHGKLTWDMYSHTQDKYTHLQATYLQRYGHYFREGDIGANLPDRSVHGTERKR
jgi:hypothetical protein